jgi:hypothetical protein
MSLYTVGGLFDPGRTSLEEGTEYNFAADQHVIKLVWRRLTLAEVAAVDHDPIQFALFVEEEQIILFLKLGEVSGWSEMPYTIWRVSEDGRTIPAMPDPAEHAGITIFLVQAETGRIAAMRFLTISPAMAMALLMAIRHQASLPFDQAHYDARLAELRLRDPTPDAFVADTIMVRIRCNGGE